MKHTLLILSCLFLMAACEQRVSTPAGNPVAADKKDPKPSKTVTQGTTDPTSLVAATTSKENNKVEKSQAAPEVVGKLELTEAEWKARLTDEEYYILRKKGTERAFTGKYDKFYKKG